MRSGVGFAAMRRYYLFSSQSEAFTANCLAGFRVILRGDQPERLRVREILRQAQLSDGLICGITACFTRYLLPGTRQIYLLAPAPGGAMRATGCKVSISSTAAIRSLLTDFVIQTSERPFP